MKKKKPIVKFDGGDLKILCSGCRRIVHLADDITVRDLTEAWALPAQYCKKCKPELYEPRKVSRIEE